MEFYEVRGTASVARDIRVDLAHGFYWPELGPDPALVRPGPFVPAVSVPAGHHLVVTDAARRDLETSNLGRITFRSVNKVHIPELHWDQWDLDKEPPVEPTGEWEDWLLEMPHSPTASDEMGPLWELRLPFSANAEAAQIEKAWKYKVRVDEATWRGDHLFLAGADDELRNWIVASAIGKEWLESQAKEWLRFTPCVR